MAASDINKVDVDRVEDTIEQEKEHIVHDDPHIAAIEDNPPEPERLSWATLLSIGFLGISPVAPISCGFLIVTSILGNIGLDLGDLTHLGWMVSGWAIASSVSFALAGRLSDIFGRRYVVLLGQFVSLIGAARLLEPRRNHWVLIAASTLLGFSCGLILVVYAAIPELCPFKYRGLGLAYAEACLYVPWGTIAVLLGKLFVEHASWRWCYYIAIIYAAVSLIGTSILYFPPSRPRHDSMKSRWRQFQELDFIGIALYTGGLTVLLLGLSWAGSTDHPRNSASIIAPIVVGFVVFSCFFAYDWTIVEKSQGLALFPLHLFSRFREYTVLLIVVFVAGMIFYSMSALLPQATGQIFTSDGTEIGVILLPNGFGQLLGSIILPSFLHKTKSPKYHIVTAIFVQTLFVGLYIYTLPSHKSAWMAFQFFGQGCFAWITVCSIVNAGLHVRQSDLGIAVGLLGTFRSLGGSVGNAVFGTILSGVLGQQLGPRITDAALSNGFDVENLSALINAVISNAAGSPDAFANVPGVTANIEAATAQAYREAAAYAYQIVFYSAIPFGVIALVASLFIKDGGKQMTNYTSIRMEKDVLGGKSLVKGVQE